MRNHPSEPKVEGVAYGLKTECVKPGPILEGDIGSQSTKVCTKWECQRWEDGQPIMPLLIKPDRYYICPVCSASYGESPFFPGDFK